MCAGVSASFIWKICYARMNVSLQNVNTRTSAVFICWEACSHLYAVRGSTRASPNAISYVAWWFAFLAAFRWDFEDFFIVFRCFLEAFFNLLFSALADFLSNSRELRAYSATPGLCALAGIDQATFRQIRNAKIATRFMQEFPLTPKVAPVYTHPAGSRHCGAI